MQSALVALHDGPGGAQAEVPGAPHTQLWTPALERIKRTVAARAASLLAAPAGQQAFGESYAVYQEELKTDITPHGGVPAGVGGRYLADIVLQL